MLHIEEMDYFDGDGGNKRWPWESAARMTADTLEELRAVERKYGINRRFSPDAGGVGEDLVYITSEMEDLIINAETVRGGISSEEFDELLRVHRIRRSQELITGPLFG